MGIFAKDRNGTGDATPAVPLPYNAQRTLTASAARIKLDDPSEAANRAKRTGTDSWQRDAWEYYDAIGEIKSAALLVGAILSRVRLYAAVVENPDEPPISVTDAVEREENPIDSVFAGRAQRALLRLSSAHGGIGGLVSRAGVNLWVAGECNLVQVPAKLGSGIPERWDIKSVDELILSTGKGGAKIRTSRNGTTEDLPDGAFVGRIWRAHPRYSDEADSSIKSVRDACDEMLLYSKLSRTVGRARMNAGALLLPDGLSITEKQDGIDEDEVVDPLDPMIITTDSEDDTMEFEDELMAAMTTPIQDEDSASAVVPLIIRGPADLLKEVRTISFDRTLDPELIARSDRALERVIQGLDIPKDIVTGLANVKYSNAVQIDESMYKAHIEPLILLVCDALTSVYFRPALVALGHDELAKTAVIWYDPTEILTRPDRHQTANDGHDRNVISDDTWRRMNGFSEADAPSTRELIVRTILARGPITDTMIDTLFKLLDPEMFKDVRDQAIEGSPVPLSDHARSILEGDTPSAPDEPDNAAPPDNATPAPESDDGASVPPPPGGAF